MKRCISSISITLISYWKLPCFNYPSWFARFGPPMIQHQGILIDDIWEWRDFRHLALTVAVVRDTGTERSLGFFRFRRWKLVRLKPAMHQLFNCSPSGSSRSIGCNALRRPKSQFENLGKSSFQENDDNQWESMLLIPCLLLFIPNIPAAPSVLSFRCPEKMMQATLLSSIAVARGNLGHYARKLRWT